MSSEQSSSCRTHIALRSHAPPALLPKPKARPSGPAAGTATRCSLSSPASATPQPCSQNAHDIRQLGTALPGPVPGSLPSRRSAARPRLAPPHTAAHPPQRAPLPPQSPANREPSRRSAPPLPALRTVSERPPSSPFPDILTRLAAAPPALKRTRATNMATAACSPPPTRSHLAAARRGGYREAESLRAFSPYSIGDPKTTIPIILFSNQWERSAASTRPAPAGERVMSSPVHCARAVPPPAAAASAGHGAGGGARGCAVLPLRALRCLGLPPCRTGAPRPPFLPEVSSRRTHPGSGEQPHGGVQRPAGGERGCPVPGPGGGGSAAGAARCQPPGRGGRSRPAPLCSAPASFYGRGEGGKIPNQVSAALLFFFIIIIFLLLEGKDEERVGFGAAFRLGLLNCPPSFLPFSAFVRTVRCPTRGSAAERAWRKK